MKPRIGAFLILLVLTGIVQLYPFSSQTGASETVWALGFVLLAGFLLGELVIHLRLPRVSGYLFAGILFGPYIGGILEQDAVEDLVLINGIALSLIALSAGGELHLAALKKGWRQIAAIVGFQFLGIFLLAGSFFYLAVVYFPFWQGFTAMDRLCVALVFGVIAVGQSPALTIAIITETRASGPITDLTLGVAIIKDVCVITLFTIVMTAVGILQGGMEAFRWSQFGALGRELFFSMLAGAGLGVGISQFLRWFNQNRIFFLLAVSYLVSVGCKTFHLDLILVCVFAGAWVTNASKRGEELIAMIEEGALLIYVIFFCVAGASLNLQAVLDMKWIALLLVGMRMLFVATATTGGVFFARIPVPSVSTYWMAFLPQAGVSLGLISIVSREPYDWVPILYTLVVACIALNQIIGPIAMKYALSKTGETRAA
ncbi:MAG: cation:proton antiporter [bacterium]|jgi:Kef-type K+ transport system membrane component KefB|nr:cation:proton antiporter [bacterium]